MKAYGYNPVTKEYIGEVNCQPDPIDGGFLLPGSSTFLEPPITKEKEVAVLKNGKWKIKEDHRDEIYWDKDTKEEQKIIDIGQVKDENWTELQPISDRCIWKKDKWIELPLTFEELQEKEKADFAGIMPDIVKELQFKIQTLEEKVTTLKTAKKIAE